MGSSGSKKRRQGTTIENYVSWFEIPAHDLQRAVAFYNRIYGISMETLEMNGYAMAFFPASGGVGGAVVTGEGCLPAQAGTLIYLNGGKDLDQVLGKVEEAGGRIVMGKTMISEEAGYFAIFIDSEGNKLALHSKS